MELLTRIGDIRRPHYAPNLLHSFEIRRETAMHAEDLFIDDGRDGKAVEAIRERLPQLNIVASLACQCLECVPKKQFLSGERT